MNNKKKNTIVLPRIEDRISQLYDAYLLDLDGTVLLGNKLIPGAKKVIKILKSFDKHIFFISNNSTSSPASYAKQLTLLGIPTANEDVINSSMVLINFLILHSNLMSADSTSDMASQGVGLNVTNSESNVDAVIVSFDRNFNYIRVKV